MNSARFHASLFKLFFLDVIEKSADANNGYIKTVDDVYIRAVVNETHFFNRDHVDKFYDTICSHYAISKLEVLADWIENNLALLKRRYIVSYILKHKKELDHYILNSTINDVYQKCMRSDEYYKKMESKGDNKLYRKLRKILDNE